jgi:hypothetical protein
MSFTKYFEVVLVVFFVKVDHPLILRLSHSIRAESSANFILEFVTCEEYKLRSSTNHQQ